VFVDCPHSIWDRFSSPIWRRSTRQMQNLSSNWTYKLILATISWRAVHFVTMGMNEHVWHHRCSSFMRYAVVIQLLFLIGPLYLSSVIRWGSKTKHHKCTSSKEVGLHLHILKTTQPIVNTTGRTYIFFSEEIHKHPLLITISKLTEVSFSIRFLLMLHTTKVSMWS
jgi:hypothetical protein